MGERGKNEGDKGAHVFSPPPTTESLEQATFRVARDEIKEHRRVMRYRPIMH